jgi:hypothetical protein
MLGMIRGLIRLAITGFGPWPIGLETLNGTSSDDRSINTMLTSMDRLEIFSEQKARDRKDSLVGVSVTIV